MFFLLKRKKIYLTFNGNKYFKGFKLKWGEWELINF